MFTFLDFIKNEILSQNNLDFLNDENLLSQWTEGPLKMEEDVSFDYFNLPNTLECMTNNASAVRRGMLSFVVSGIFSKGFLLRRAEED